MKKFLKTDEWNIIEDSFQADRMRGRKAYSALGTAVSDNGDILKSHIAATAIAAHSWQA